LVEQETLNLLVVGSTPTRPTKFLSLIKALPRSPFMGCKIGQAIGQMIGQAVRIGIKSPLDMGY
jgi:hypothetical protein